MFQSLINMLKNMFGKVISGTTRPKYVVSRIGAGKFDIAVTIPQLGTHHYMLEFDAEKDTFVLSGKVAVVGDAAGFPINVFTDMINTAFQVYVEDAVVKEKLQTHRKKMIAQHSLHMKNLD